MKKFLTLIACVVLTLCSLGSCTVATSSAIETDYYYDGIDGKVIVYINSTPYYRTWVNNAWAYTLVPYNRIRYITRYRPHPHHGISVPPYHKPKPYIYGDRTPRGLTHKPEPPRQPNNRTSVTPSRRPSVAPNSRSGHVAPPRSSMPSRSSVGARNGSRGGRR